MIWRPQLFGCMPCSAACTPESSTVRAVPRCVKTERRARTVGCGTRSPLFIHSLLFFVTKWRGLYRPTLPSCFYTSIPAPSGKLTLCKIGAHSTTNSSDRDRRPSSILAPSSAASCVARVSGVACFRSTARGVKAGHFGPTSAQIGSNSVEDGPNASGSGTILTDATDIGARAIKGGATSSIFSRF